MMLEWPFVEGTTVAILARPSATYRGLVSSCFFMLGIGPALSIVGGSGILLSENRRGSVGDSGIRGRGALPSPIARTGRLLTERGGCLPTPRIVIWSILRRRRDGIE